jgi:hypothetical protein
MLGLFARAGLSAIPGSSLLPFVAGGSREVPDLTLTLNDVAIDRDKLAEYSRVCGFDVRDAVPPTYPHILAFPLHLALLTDATFPFGPLGLVHIENRIVQHRPLSASEALSLHVSAGPLRPHSHGRVFEITTEARVGDELVWEEVSTNLKRGPGSDAPTQRPKRTQGDLEATATWTLPGDLGRRYGAASGDLNPIHLHPLTARVFGFTSAIAHGMWTKARCLAALGPQLPDAFTVEVAFRRPILLPATVEFSEGPSERDHGLAFAVRSADRKRSTHLVGTVR